MLTRDRFTDPAWIFERKLDGERCLGYVSGPQVRLLTRNSKVVTGTYPEIADALRAQRADDFIVDGEVVAFDGGQTRTMARPTTDDRRIGPKTRLSWELARLSPMTQSRSGGTINLGKVDVVVAGGR